MTTAPDAVTGKHHGAHIADARARADSGAQYHRPIGSKGDGTMKIYYEAINEYTPWSGAIDTYNAIRDAGKLDLLEAVLEEIYPEGMSETALNDLLWFEPEAVYEWLGMPNPDEEDEDENDEDENEHSELSAA